MAVLPRKWSNVDAETATGVNKAWECSSLPCSKGTET